MLRETMQYAQNLDTAEIYDRLPALFDDFHNFFLEIVKRQQK